MPFVRRRAVAENRNTTYAKSVREYDVYVAPKDVKRSDVIIPPEKIPPKILAELAAQHPEEFAQAAADTGAVGSSSARLAALATANAKDVAAAVRDMDPAADEAFLWTLLEHEQDREEGPRKTVLEALASKGVEVEGVGEGDEDEE